MINTITCRANIFKKFFILALVCSFNLMAQKPDENRFTKVVLAEKLDEPMEMAILKDGRILICERKGGIKQWDPVTEQMTLVATIPVNTKYTNAKGQIREAEEGLVGISVDPNFEKNHWIYLLYADPAEPKHVLARFEFVNEKLVQSSKKLVIEYPVQRQECCHTGGGMTWDKTGNLFLTIGNNTSNSGTPGYANLDERQGWENWDDQRGAGNTNDLRGKILRIKPEDNGGYSIPEGNLFKKGTEKTKPEIYVMGNRNPWRVSVDSKTGYIYWGEVGPDASLDTDQGPRGYDEFNQAKKPGNFGWPYFIGDNKAYADWDFEAKKPKDSKFDPNKPVNDSPNNTGLKDLPPAQKAFIWYPYANSDEFPLVGASGRSATGGPVFRKDDFKNAERLFPAYYEGKWLAVEFMRGWIMAVTMDENGDYKSMERFMPNESFGSAIDMQFAHDGDLYVLEYGTAWFKGNENARLVKVSYNSGNRQPTVALNADKTGGAIPFKVKLSAEGSIDPDGDALEYEWKISSKQYGTRSYKGAIQNIDFTKPGKYTATLYVNDKNSPKSKKSIEILAGNEPPKVAFEFAKGNKTFYFPNKSIDYKVNVEDKEDGSIANGKIKPENVAVNIDYLPIGYDKIEISQNHRIVDALLFASEGEKLVAKSDCKSCHVMDKKSVGPSYIDISKKYLGNTSIHESIAKKIINGGTGVWGDHAMSAHPQLSQADANAMVSYIVGLTEKKTEVKNRPISGNYATNIPQNQKDKGSFVLRAAYKDKGSKNMPGISSEETLILRNPVISPELAENTKGYLKLMTPGIGYYVVGQEAYLGYKQIDFTDIKQIEVGLSANSRNGSAGGIMEVRIDSPTGTLLGKSEKILLTERKPGENPQNRPASKSIIDVASNGIHDVYFVFKNPDAKENQIQMQIREFEFKSN
jgi:cytochrome c